MVVFVDLESEDDDPYERLSSSLDQHLRPQRFHDVGQKNHHCGLETFAGADDHAAGNGNYDPNGKLFASALACYPISLSIASQLDLNDLYSLSVTCRQIHDTLNAFARQLRTKSLHCTNDLPQRTSEEEVDAIIFQEAMSEIPDIGTLHANAPAFPLPYTAEVNHIHVGSHSALGLRGKISQCARDLVAPCRKCGITVCRNCAVKPPSDRCLPNRFRRLCKTCLEAPVIDHLHMLKSDYDLSESPPTSSASSARSVVSDVSSGSIRGGSPRHTTSFTFSTFLRQPCSCVSRGVFLCQPCGQSLNAADTMYKRVWTWRSRYSTHIGGGLGTGLGQGNQGQKCGRGQYCLEQGAEGVCWVEIECSDARVSAHLWDDSRNISRSSTPLAEDGEREPSMTNRPGYLSQEMEGIGGVVKKKVKKRVKVGATVHEFDDERETSRYLQREVDGKLRSWCGWCSRVCPSTKDEAAVRQLLGLQN